MDEEEPRDRVAEAVDATASAYTQDSGLDIRERLMEELEGRDVRHEGAAWLDELVDAVRAGHSGEVTDGSRQHFPTS